MYPLPFKRIVIASVALALLVVGVMYAIAQSARPAPIEPAPVVHEAISRASHSILGASVEGRTIDAYTYGNGPSHLLFVGGVHGGYEWNSVVLAYMVMDYFAAHPDAVPQALSVTIIPDANPDGVFKIIGKEGRFAASDVPQSEDQSEGRFNAHEVDLNRNFDCKWQPESTWRTRTVSGGTAAFSEPESRAIRDYVHLFRPVAAIFWHSKANAVYASECEEGILPETRALMNAYATAAGYPTVDSFDSYAVTGDAEGWLASIGIPAITVEIKTHEDVEWDRNLAGVKALLQYYSGH